VSPLDGDHGGMQKAGVPLEAGAERIDKAFEAISVRGVGRQGPESWRTVRMRVGGGGGATGSGCGSGPKASNSAGPNIFAGGNKRYFANIWKSCCGRQRAPPGSGGGARLTEIAKSLEANVTLVTCRENWIWKTGEALTILDDRIHAALTSHAGGDDAEDSARAGWAIGGLPAEMRRSSLRD